jgi:cysteinyl-tRNA synthetase
VQALLDARASARAERDFATADRIRTELGERGYSVIDGPNGQVIERR